MQKIKGINEKNKFNAVMMDAFFPLDFTFFDLIYT